MGFYIYIIHNILNNKIYVGKTKDLKKRWSSHLSQARIRATNQYISQQQVSRIVNGKKWKHLFLEAK